MQGVLEPGQEGDVEPAIENSNTSSDENVETESIGTDDGVLKKNMMY